MYLITHVEFRLRNLEGSHPYGFIRVYFGSNESYKTVGRINLTKYNALATLLKSGKIAYDPSAKEFTNTFSNSDIKTPPNSQIQ